MKKIFIHSLLTLIIAIEIMIGAPNAQSACFDLNHPVKNVKGSLVGIHKIALRTFICVEEDPKATDGKVAVKPWLLVCGESKLAQKDAMYFDVLLNRLINETVPKVFIPELEKAGFKPMFFWGIIKGEPIPELYIEIIMARNKSGWIIEKSLVYLVKAFHDPKYKEVIVWKREKTNLMFGNEDPNEKIKTISIEYIKEFIDSVRRANNQ